MRKKQDDENLPPSLRQYHVVTAALHQLGGAARAIDTEDVAVRAFELAPDLFQWQKYPEQINLELVRVALSDAKKPKNGALTSGSGRSGWRLTQRGLAWAQQASVAGPVEAGQGGVRSRRTAGSVDVVRRNREQRRIELSPAWVAWKKGQPIGPRDARVLFRIDQYTTDEMIELKVVRLMDMPWSDSGIKQYLVEAAEVLRRGNVQ
jgi:hypothetical protein